MMIDGVVPLGCGRASLYRPSIGVVRMMAAGGRKGVGHGGMATVHRLPEGRRFPPASASPGQAATVA